MHTYRSHTCNQLKASDVGKTVRLSGWVHRKRDHGQLLFIDLRDHYGITQCVISVENPLFERASALRPESVIKVDGAVVARSPETLKNVTRGGYVLQEAKDARAAIIATGSEVAIAIDAQKLLAEQGIAVRVVSMPSTDVFDRQDDAWRASVLPKGMPRVAVEAGVTAFWHKYVGLDGAVVGIDTYGESAPAGALFKYFGLTAEKVAEAVKRVL